MKRLRLLAPGTLGRYTGSGRVTVLTPGAAFCPHDTDGDGCERESGDQNTSCGSYSDAMVCINAANDLACSSYDTDKYRGCYYGNVDRDDGSDYCCAGWMADGGRDNIDHGECAFADAHWGESCPAPYDVCYPFWDVEDPPPP